MAHAHQPAVRLWDEVHRADVGGENLEGGEPGLDGLPGLGYDVGGDLAHEHTVVGVVAVGLAPPTGGPLLYGLEDVYALALDGEVGQGCGAPKEGRSADLFGRGRLCADLSCYGRCDVGVRFDTPRDHYLARGVYYPTHIAAGQGALLGYGHYLFALHGHVPASNPPGGHYLAASNDEVHHLPPP